MSTIGRILCPACDCLLDTPPGITTVIFPQIHTTLKTTILLLQLYYYIAMHITKKVFILLGAFQACVRHPVFVSKSAIFCQVAHPFTIQASLILDNYATHKQANCIISKGILINPLTQKLIFEAPVYF